MATADGSAIKSECEQQVEDCEQMAAMGDKVIQEQAKVIGLQEQLIKNKDEQLQVRIEQLKEITPAFYERPLFVGTVGVAIGVIATILIVNAAKKATP